MEKLYQVFLSSTYEDIKQERLEIISALQNLNCRVVSMEMFPSSSMSKWEYMKRMIEKSDYFLLISAGRYGEIVEDGKSYSELEYEYAVSLDKPILVLLYEDISKIPDKKSESSIEGKNRLNLFRELLQKNRLVKRWKNRTDLLKGLYQSTLQLIKDVPVPGWIRAEDITNHEFVLKLQQENILLGNQLQEINQAGVINAVVEFYNGINWKHLFTTSKNIDLLFAYAQTWRNNNIVELRNFITKSDHRIRLILPDPENPLIIKVIALRSQKTEERIKELIEEAEQQFNILKHSNICKACIKIKYLDFIPLYGWFSFDEFSVLTLHSHRKGRYGNPTFLLGNGIITQHLKEEFDALFGDK